MSKAWSIGLISYLRVASEIVDENALAEQLTKNKIHGVGLDVFEHEPQVSTKLLESKNGFTSDESGSSH
mgnify:CR=1 FL=1